MVSEAVMSCGGDSFSSGCACGSAWDSVMPMKGKYTINYIQYLVVGCVCMLNGLFSSIDTICADNYIYFRFKLQACFAVRNGSCICTAILPSWWTVIVWKCCSGVCLRLGFTLFGNGSHHLCVVPPSERGMGMSMPLSVPVSSGIYSGTCVSTALLWNLTRCPSHLYDRKHLRCHCSCRVHVLCVADCVVSVAPMCSVGACVALSWDGGRFTPDGAVHGMMG